MMNRTFSGFDLANGADSWPKANPKKVPTSTTMPSAQRKDCCRMYPPRGSAALIVSAVKPGSKYFVPWRVRFEPVQYGAGSFILGILPRRFLLEFGSG